MNTIRIRAVDGAISVHEGYFPNFAVKWNRKPGETTGGFRLFVYVAIARGLKFSRFFGLTKAVG